MNDESSRSGAGKSTLIRTINGLERVERPLKLAGERYCSRSIVANPKKFKFRELAPRNYPAVCRT